MKTYKTKGSNSTAVEWLPPKWGSFTIVPWFGMEKEDDRAIEG